MLTRRSFVLSAAATLAAPKAFARDLLPKVYTWIGNSGPTLYWDDPQNWANGEYPNQREAMAVFAHTIKQDTTILLRQDIHLARFWFSEEKYSYTIAADPAALDPKTAEPPKLVLDTIGEYSSTTLDNDNKVAHTYAAMITHSCHWGFPGVVPEDEDYVPTIRFNGRISNYKDPRRASLQVNGPMKFELNAVNTFVGPIVAVNGGEVSAGINGAVPELTPIYLSNLGRLSVAKGVLIRTAKLVVDDELLSPGIYHSPTLTPSIGKLLQAEIALLNERASGGQMSPLPNIAGEGAILVQ